MKITWRGRTDEHRFSVQVQVPAVDVPYSKRDAFPTSVGLMIARRHHLDGTINPWSLASLTVSGYYAKKDGTIGQQQCSYFPWSSYNRKNWPDWLREAVDAVMQKVEELDNA